MMIQKLNDLLEKFKVVFFNTQEKIEEEKPIVKIGNATICSEGNICGMIGGPKSGKSTGTSGIIAGALQTSEEVSSLDTIGFDVKVNNEKKGVIYIDTEQSKRDFNKFVKNILRRAKLSEAPDFFYAYNCKRNSIDERKEFVKKLFSIVNEINKGIHLAIIDGIADFVKSVNNEEECNKIIDLFLKLSEQYKTTIILVIHQNPGKEKTRGHLGSQLERKAESILKVFKRNGYSVIVSSLLRNAGGFDPINFAYNQELGYAVVTDNKDENQDLEFLSKIFEGKESLKKKEIVDEIMKQFNIKDSAAYNKIKAMEEKGLLKFDEENKVFTFHHSS